MQQKNKSHLGDTQVKECWVYLDHEEFRCFNGEAKKDHSQSDILARYKNIYGRTRRVNKFLSLFGSKPKIFSTLIEKKGFILSNLKTEYQKYKNGEIVRFKGMVLRFGHTRDKPPFESTHFNTTD